MSACEADNRKTENWHGYVQKAHNRATLLNFY